MSANARTRGRRIGAVVLSALLALMALVPLAATTGAQDASPEASPVAAGLGLELPEIDEADVNPVRVADGAAVAADALFALRS